MLYMLCFICIERAGTGEGKLLIGGLASAWGEELNSANFDTVSPKPFFVPAIHLTVIIN